MAIQNQPGFIPAPFANSGTKNVIPETMPTPSASAAASWTDGFPTVCSLPLASGGIPPARADFNGLFNSITQAQAFYQSGGVYEWDATVDYGVHRMVLGSDGKLYWSMAQSGPNVAAGAQDPTTDDGTYWGTAPIKSPSIGDKSAKMATTEWVKDLSLPIYVDAVNGLDSNDGMSASTAFKTVGAALASPVSDFGLPIELNVAAGTYNESISIVSRNIKINLTGAVVVTGKISIINNSDAVFNGSGTLSVDSSLNNLIDISDNSISIFNIPIYVNNGSSGSDASKNCLYVGYFSSCIVNNGAVFSATNNSNCILFVNVFSNLSIKGDVTATGSIQSSLLYSARNSNVYIRDGSFDASSLVCNTVFEITIKSSCFIENETLNVKSTGSFVFDISNQSLFREVDSDCTFTSDGVRSHVLSCGNSSLAYIYVSSGKTVNIVSSNGKTNYCIDAGDCSVVNLNGTGTLNITGTYDTVCNISVNSTFYLRPAMTVTGNPTGKRYNVGRGGMIIVNGSGANRIPGSTAGTVDSASFGYYN